MSPPPIQVENLGFFTPLSTCVSCACDNASGVPEKHMQVAARVLDLEGPSTQTKW